MMKPLLQERSLLLLRVIFITTLLFAVIDSSSQSNTDLLTPTSNNNNGNIYYQYSLPTSEINALYDLYISNHGDQWEWKNNTDLYGIPWDFTAYLASGMIPHVCQQDTMIPINGSVSNSEEGHWQGIECSSNCSVTPCHIISLSLSNYGLDGTLPSSLMNLTALSLLDVSDNDIHSAIPDTVGNLSLLTYLSLSSNRMNGSLPQSLYQLSLLNHFEIDNNRFTGTLSDRLGYQWPLLSYFNIESCLFQGSLPSTLLHLYYLEYFLISNNQYLTNTPSYPLFSNLTTPNLKVLAMQAVYLPSSTIPDCYYSLSQLQIFAIGSNGGSLYGTISEAIQNWSQLQILSLSITSLSGSLPDSLTTLSQLSILDIEYSFSLTGSLPENFNKLKSLQELYLIETSFTGSWYPIIPLNEFAMLEKLELFYNGFSGSLPTYIMNRSDSNVTNKLWYYDMSENHFTGTLPLSLSTSLLNIQFFSVQSNLLTSSVPETFFDQWQDVTMIYLSSNHLTGSFPETMFQTMPKLQYFGAVSCYFSGHLPKQYIAVGSNSSSLNSIQLDRNLLSGSIPVGFCQLHALKTLSTEVNFFSHALPDCFFTNMTSLTAILIQLNEFTGPFPSVTSWIPQLQELALGENRFTGSIPSEGWEMMPHLIFVTINDNLFSGEFPILLMKFNGSEVDVSNNLLYGTIPFSATKSSTTAMYYFDYNEFEGDISELFENISTKITGLQLNHNQFTGRIVINDIETANSLSLGVFDISSNSITGTIPPSISGLRKLGTINFGENFLMGSFPDSTGDMTALKLVNVSFNMMTGTIPATWNQLTSLNYVDLSNNAFSGNLQGKLNNSVNLLSLLVKNNALTGRIDDSLLSAKCTTLQALDFSSNLFTGSLPTKMFSQSPQTLASYAAVKNCLTGTIPDTICDATVMMQLALDGLHSADQCNHIIYESSSLSKIVSQSSYMLKRPITGTIPSCLFSMPYLQLLHLSGNGIHDQLSDLPMSSSIGPFLKDLALSNNALYGSIPDFIQQHHWEKLDLSFNFFNGELRKDFNHIESTSTTTYSDQQNTTSLSLFVNRLSGTIPSSLLHLPITTSIDILKGNIFSCHYNDYGENEGLPSHDENAKSYSCGSNAVNASIYAFVAIFSTMIVIVILCILYFRPYYQQPSNNSIDSSSSSYCSYFFRSWSILVSWWLKGREWFEHFSGKRILFSLSTQTTNESLNDMITITNFLQLNQNLRRFACILTAVIVIVLMSTYSLLSHSFSTYTYKYSYRLGFMYLNGSTSAISLFVILIAFYLLMKFLLYRNVRLSRKTDAYKKNLESNQTTWGFVVLLFNSIPKSMSWVDFKEWLVSCILWHLYWFFPIVILFVVNALVTLAVNMSYVYSETLDNLSDASVLAIALAVSLFKVIWNNVVILNLMPTYLHFFKHRLLSTTTPERNHQTKGRIEVSDADVSTHELHDDKLNPSKVSQLLEHLNATPEQQIVQTIPQNIPQFDLHHYYNRQILVILLMISIFTNVVSPYISSFFINPNCFYYTVKTMDPITSSYTFPQCYRYDAFSGLVSCTGYHTITRIMSFIPPFIYNYQCSSSLIQSFNVVYIYRYVISGMILPMALIIGCSIHQSLKRRFDRFRQQQQNEDKKPLMIDKVLQCIYWMLELGLPLGWKLCSSLKEEEEDEGARSVGCTNHQLSQSSTNGSISLKPTLEGRESSLLHDVVDAVSNSKLADTSSIDIEKSKTDNPMLEDVELNDGKTDLTAIASSPNNSIIRPMLVQIFSRETYVLRLAGEFSVLLTFGIVFPPLAIVICIAILTQTLMTQRSISKLLLIGKRIGTDNSINDITTMTSLNDTCKALLSKFPVHFHQECQEITEFISLLIPYISMFMMAFLSFSLFDTMADSNGDVAGFILMGCLAVLPFIEYTLYEFRKIVLYFK